MNLDQLQAELAERGCVLWVEGEMLRFRAPDGALSPQLMTQLRRNKRELIARLRRGSQAVGRGSHTQEPSFGQQAMWLLHDSAPKSPAYNVASAIRIDTHVDYDALKRVWHTLLARHDSLRTTFEICAGKLVSRVHDQALADIEHVPACGESDAQLQSRVKECYERPFDLSAGPLARLRLFTVAPDRHVLLMAMHHIVLDAWSLWVLHDELGALYEQEAQGAVGMLPAVAAKYSDFVRWQQETPNTEAGREQWLHWKACLEDGPEPARLPWDRPRPARIEQRGGSLHFRLPVELAESLREVGRQRGATPFMTLMSVFQTLLHLHSGQQDFLVGTTTSGRSKREFNRLVGYLVNTLPLRAQIDPAMRFSQLLEQTREVALSAIAAQDFPFPLMVERLNPPRETGALPLCRVMFGLQKPHDFSEAMLALDDADRSINWGGLAASAFPLDQQEGQFDLTLEMYETSSTFLGLLKYDTNLLDRESAQLLADRFVFLAEQLAADPDLPLDELQLATPEEEQQIASWQLPSTDTSDASRIEQLFSKRVVSSPDAIAIEAEDATCTFGEVDRRANQLAHWLHERGIQPGDRVACCMERGASAWIAHLACLKAGAVYVPLDDAGPTARLEKLIGNCQAKLLLSDTATAQRLDLAAAELSATLELLDEATEEISACEDIAINNDQDGSSAAYLIYTSGSTGEPKGVVVSHQAFVAHVNRIQSVYEITSDDVVLQFSAMTFDPSLEQAWVAWSAGARLVVRGQQLWSTAEFCQRIAKHGITVANVPPAYFRECSEMRRHGDRPQTPLRLVIVGGDTFPKDTLSAWQDSSVQILNAYGPTEAVVTATVAEVSAQADTGRVVPIGRPLPGTQALVVDAKLRRCAIGVPGELLLSGPALADGYLGDAQHTQERFFTAPRLTEDQQTLYRTGDLVRWNHRGQLEFLGRIDRQIKVNGYRIELGEVERSLELVPGVKQVVAQVQASGQESCLVAYYTTQADSTVEPNTLAAAIRHRLPHYMVPRALQQVAEFPRKPSGKVDNAQLPTIAINGAIASRAFAAPENSLQQVLAEVWQEVLGVDRVGIHDDFFELGGASLKSLQIVSAAEARGVRLADETLSPALLFEYPTVAQLAELLVFTNDSAEVGAAY